MDYIIMIDILYFNEVLFFISNFTRYLLLIGSFIFSYLIGSIPTGYWFAKYFFGIDVTRNGSGNIGATNIARVLGNKKYFFLIFFIDFLKAFFCLGIMNLFLKNFFWTIQNFNEAFLILWSIFLLIGNAYSIFLNFKGGKGVATTLGILVYLFPINVFLIFFVCWIIILFWAKRVDLASLFSIYIIFIFYFSLFNYSINCLFFLLFICCWITFRHKENIKKCYNL
ncbi:glycerol-3-phosphate acyltransferase [Candidatus Dependentiae bacterium]|nr:glycerol-3-phosphate acyltransferase [Candidatus Dependentiae bacterium]